MLPRTANGDAKRAPLWPLACGTTLACEAACKQHQPTHRVPSALVWRQQRDAHARGQRGARREQARERRAVPEWQEALLASAARGTHLIRAQVQ